MKQVHTSTHHSFSLAIQKLCYPHGVKGVVTCPQSDVLEAKNGKLGDVPLTLHPLLKIFLMHDPSTQAAGEIPSTKQSQEPSFPVLFTEDSDLIRDGR